MVIRYDPNPPSTLHGEGHKMTSESTPPQLTRRDFLKGVGAGLTHFSVVNITIGDLSHFLFLNDSEKENSEGCQTAFSDINKLLGEKCMLGDECAFSDECGMITRNGCIFGDEGQEEGQSLQLFGNIMPCEVCIGNAGICPGGDFTLCIDIKCSNVFNIICGYFTPPPKPSPSKPKPPKPKPPITT